MDGIHLAEHLLKAIQEQLVGNVESLDYIGQELREILEKAD